MEKFLVFRMRQKPSDLVRHDPTRFKIVGIRRCKTLLSDTEKKRVYRLQLARVIPADAVSWV